MLEFTKTCPDPISLWKTIDALTIAPGAGFTPTQIKFIIFLNLRLSEDFTKTKLLMNEFILNRNPVTPVLAELYTIFQTTYGIALVDSYLTNLTITTTAEIITIVGLETPLIYIRQLLKGMKFGSSMLLIKLFDIYTDSLIFKHITNDVDSNPSFISEYLLNTSVTNEAMLSMVKFDPDKPFKTPVKSTLEIEEYIRLQLTNSIKASENNLMPISAKTTIPEFVLGNTTTTTKDQVDIDNIKTATEWTERTSPPSISWDDVRVGTKLKCISKDTADRAVGKIYTVTKFEGKNIFISSDTGDSSGTTAYWKEHFTIEEL